MDAGSRHHHDHHLRPSSKAIYLIQTQVSKSSKRFPSSRFTPFGAAFSGASTVAGAFKWSDGGTTDGCDRAAEMGQDEEGASRRLLVPSWYTLLQLHVVLQIVYGLPDARQPHTFEVVRESHDVEADTRASRSSREEKYTDLPGINGGNVGTGGRQRHEGFHPSSSSANASATSKDFLLGGGIVIDTTGVHHLVMPSLSAIGTTTFSGRPSPRRTSSKSTSALDRGHLTKASHHVNTVSSDRFSGTHDDESWIEEDDEDESLDGFLEDLNPDHPSFSPVSRPLSPSSMASSGSRSISRRRSDDLALNIRSKAVGGMVGGHSSKPRRRTSLQPFSPSAAMPSSLSSSGPQNGEWTRAYTSKRSARRASDGRVVQEKEIGRRVKSVDLIRYKIVEPQNDLVISQYAPACYIQHSHPHARPSTVLSDDPEAYEFSYFENVRDERFFRLEEVLSKSHETVLYKYHDFSKESVIEITINVRFEAT
ncbi:hypothetical protein HDU67_007230 [Dinochytrium kinnereticum]|nr:hypothetical protein HDU67_007230 [Dinochytrium kinnereticum]